MRATLSNYWIITITLFALVGQGLITNDSLMVPMAHAQMTQEKISAQTNTATDATLPMPHKAMTDCHDNAPNLLNNVDESNNTPPPKTGCCNGSGFCSIDCNHCLTISLVANLIDIQQPMINIPIFPAPISMVVNRISIAFQPAFRPPIA